MGMPSKKDPQCARRMSVGTVESQALDIANMHAYFKERPALVESAFHELEKISNDPVVKKINRRHSDQFRAVETNRLFSEMENNRKLRMIHKFQKDHVNISSITDKWREVLLCAFEDLVKYTEAKPIELYKGFHLKTIHVDKEEVGIYSEYESETEEE
ncbi:hypothetical protein NEAUS04_1053 [Nematocida ausubeli]|uniref:Uncharacterized protein n=1 Tax=Nematocida ausubeli (strain ATCC PRA-371 / ERTm2) TaxID=1913371 RepID=H8ZES2_NEMA1|nr:uncharacterized protein NESG_01571 [Nematocida ausubeli]EHY65037.1 hypothetical protein NERG_02093 [Nematocida ausubeli]KAI5134348.1 hypothetical protein NEAUS06_1045 [Nematocida ausubeli]KAI5137465.1 hypothetical protein NEAUS07_1988 [Nematocida ausubeli]KAI5149788.1 hypothetical protein NEAUS05_1906 [Nematocida ausubeli]KAI5162595.1 hypothetical protein NEAUS04_1053 [Nematocida ausubeli]